MQAVTQLHFRAEHPGHAPVVVFEKCGGKIVLFQAPLRLLGSNDAAVERIADPLAGERVDEVAGIAEEHEVFAGDRARFGAERQAVALQFAFLFGMGKTLL